MEGDGASWLTWESEKMMKHEEKNWKADSSSPHEKETDQSFSEKDGQSLRKCQSFTKKKGKHNWSDRQIGQVAAAPTPEDLDLLHQLKIVSPSLGVSPKLISLKATDWVINEMGKMFSDPGGHWNWSNSLVTVSSNCKRSLDKLVSVAEITLAHQIVSSNFAPFIYLVGKLNCRSNSNIFKNCFR